MTHSDLATEQQYFDVLYRRLDAEIARAEERLDEVRVTSVGGLYQSRFEREAFVANLEDRLAALRAQRRDDLCFGRIDLADGRSLYIGRVGLSDDDREPLLVDWRAPVAAPFYQATPREPMGVVRRRHFMTRGREITAIEDEVLDAEHLSDDEAGSLSGEAALQYAMGTARTGRMREIAATLQREQDDVIRAPLTPAVFVQGGPGTGKTAVALHRAAYLLYTHRRQISARDLLVVGPNPVFLRYIEQVLPSLGESGVELDSLPQVYARRDWLPESPAVRGVKADPVMVDVIGRGISTRQRSLRSPVDVEIEGERVRIRPGDVEPVVAAARRRQGRHNPTALYVHDRLLRLVWRRGRHAFSEIMEFEDFRTEMLADARFRRLSQRVWPVLAPEELLNDLFGYPALLRQAADGLLDEDRWKRLARPWSPSVADVAWTSADAALLDEAARQLGPIPEELDPAQRRSSEVDPWLDVEAVAEAEYRRERMRGLGSGMMTRDMLEERLEGSAPTGDGAEADAVAGRVWRYAVVDEAQDVSPLDWRMIGRHCPRRALTVVGDLAQGTEPWSPRSWERVRTELETGPEARVAELTVNYRSPEEVGAYAAEVLRRVDVATEPPRAIRSVPGSFSARSVAPGEVVERAVDGAVALHAEVGVGIACVIAPSPLVRAVRERLEQRLGTSLPDPDDPAVLDRPVVASTPELAKGLEFDVVVLADPDAIVEETGWRGLYVSATRATQRLFVVHTGASPVPS